MVFVFIGLSCSESGVLFIRGGHTLNRYCIDFDAVFNFFPEVIALSHALVSSHFRR